MAHRYGSRPPGEVLSYTELEYEWALSHRDIALLPFVVDESFPWKPADIDSGTDAQALNRFVRRLRSGHVVKT